MICPFSAPFSEIRKRKIPGNLENKAFPEFSSAPPVVLMQNIQVL